MNATEAGQLLAFAALYDNRKVAEPDVLAWLKAIGDLPYGDCEAAVAAHYGESTERVMPGHIRTRVKAVRAERLARNPLPAPPPELADEPGRYRQAVADGIARIAGGFDARKAIGGPLPGEPPAEWVKRKEAIAPKPLSKEELALQQVEQSRRERAEREAREAGEAEAS